MADQNILGSQVTQTATTINAYCRIVELFLKGVREGIPMGVDADLVKDVMDGLKREAKFLRFLRENMTDHLQE